MATRQPFHHRFIGPATIWAEDFVSIIEILKHLSSDINIRIGDQEFVDFEDLQSKVGKAKLRSIEIGIKSPYISISASGSSLSVFTGEEDIASWNAAARIAEILTSKLRRPRLLDDVFAPYIIVGTSLPFAWSGNLSSVVTSFFFSFIALLWWVFMYVEDRHRHFLGRAIYKYESDGDSISQTAVALVIALIGAVVGAVLSFLLPKFYH